MPLKEKSVVLVLGLMISGALFHLMMFAPLGTLGAADGQSYEVDRLSIIGFISFGLAGGYLVRCQPGKEVSVEKRNTEPEVPVWPIPPMEP